MSTEKNVEELMQLSDQIKQAQVELEKLTERRNDLAITLYQAGTSARTISRLADLSETRAYQIVRAGKHAVDGTYNGQPARMSVDAQGNPWKFYVEESDEDGTWISEA